MAIETANLKLHSTSPEEGGNRCADTALVSWREWYRVCSLDLSSERTQDVLLKFAAHRFRTWTARYIARTNAGDVSSVALSARQAWHLFESHVTVKHTREGKAYKTWLFARGDGAPGDALGAVEGGASLIMRDVVRRHLAAEFSPPRTISLTMAAGVSDGTPVTVADLLPGDGDPSLALVHREVRDLARDQARQLFDGMNRRERIALLTKQARISLAHPAVLQAAGCRKSTLHEAYMQVARRVHDQIVAGHSGAGLPSVLTMAGLCLGALVELLSDWVAADKQCAVLLQRMEEFATL